jgi:hypothetical protein
MRSIDNGRPQGNHDQFLSSTNGKDVLREGPNWMPIPYPVFISYGF